MGDDATIVWASCGRVTNILRTRLSFGGQSRAPEGLSRETAGLKLYLGNGHLIPLSQTAWRRGVGETTGGPAKEEGSPELKGQRK